MFLKIITLLFVSLINILKYFLPNKYKCKTIKSEIVLITGGGSGLGQQLALQFCNENVEHIIIWDLNENGLINTKQMINNLGCKCTYYVIDVTNREQVYSTAKRINDEIGFVSILINNAGIVNFNRFLDSPDDSIINVFNVNVISHYWTIKAFLPEMMRNNYGHIVGISSTASFVSSPFTNSYCASKFAVNGIYESLLLEMLDLNKDIKFTIVCPYIMNTKLFAKVNSVLLPTLTVEYVAKRVVNAIKCNQVFLYLPRIFYLIHFFKTLLPVKTLIELFDTLGGNRAYDQFNFNNKRVDDKCDYDENTKNNNHFETIDGRKIFDNNII